jgi:arginine exporter protein ArgO
MSETNYGYDPSPRAGVSVDPARDALARRFAAIVGAVFLVVGVLGFVPGVTEDLDGIEFAGHESGAELFGIFQVSVLHNIVHLLFGVAGLAMSRTAAAARWFLIGGGVIYLVLWLYGLVIDKESAANFVPLNTADDWLHFVLGVGMIALGFLLGRSAMTRTAAQARR